MMTRRQFMGTGLGGLLAVQVAEIAGMDLGSQGAGAGDLTVTRAIESRRTVRDYSSEPVALELAMVLLWAAQGITESTSGYRAAPSAGALFPLEVFLLAGEGGVPGLEAGSYRYEPSGSRLEKLRAGDLRRELVTACMGQMWAGRTPLSLVISAVYSRSTRKYGNRGAIYTHIEAGCAAENVLLTAVSMGLSAGIIGAFSDDQLAEVVGYTGRAEPLLVLPVGYRA